MNYDLKTVNRSVYNFFNLLGDVGGLYGLFYSVLLTLNGFLNFQNPQNFLVQRLYRGESRKNGSTNDEILDARQ